MTAAPPDGWTQLSITCRLPGVALRLCGTSGAPSALVTKVAGTARLPLLAVSSAALAASATVRFVAVVVRAVVSSSKTLVPVTICPIVDTTLPPALMVILVRSTEPRFSLNVRITFVPSVDVVGASLPVVTSVGRMPSTLCPASIATAAWARSALVVVLLLAVMVPPWRGQVNRCRQGRIWAHVCHRSHPL